MKTSSKSLLINQPTSLQADHHLKSAERVAPSAADNTRLPPTRTRVRRVTKLPVRHLWTCFQTPRHSSRARQVGHMTICTR